MQLFAGRVLSEDEDFVTFEIAKRDDVSFHLQQNEEGDTVGGDRFLTLVFVHDDGTGRPEFWDPFST